MAHEKQIVVFLDYDGTLSPIVNNPDQAYMSDAVSTLSKKKLEHALIVTTHILLKIRFL